MSQLLARWIRTALVLVLAAGVAHAQDASITGVVTDAETGDPIPGANVAILEIEAGTITGANGAYTIANLQPRNAPYEVRASLVGYTAQVQDVLLTQPGQVATINFALSPGIELEGIVVTALGIERQEREIGYAVTQLRGDELLAGDNTSIISSMAGRIPGVDITQQSGNVGASSRIVLRGVTTLDHDNQPLFVVDGVPISNANIAFADGTNPRIAGGASDWGNRANDINPADIESVTILKGGAAAALYGQRAKNGVILITTRRGVDRPRGSVNVSSSFISNTVGRLPDFQTQFAGGSVGTYLPTSFNGWGPTIAGQEVRGHLLDPFLRDPLFAQQSFRNIRHMLEPYVLEPAPNNVRGYYESDLTSTNSVSFSTGTPTSDFRLGLTNIAQSGIVPNSSLDRTSVSVNAGTRFGNGFRARATANYVNTGVQGRAVQGGNDPNILGQTLNQLPRTLHLGDRTYGGHVCADPDPAPGECENWAFMENFQLDGVRTYLDEFGNHRALGNFDNNPYWLAFENLNTNGIQRVFGSGEVGYDPLDWVTVTLRVGTDFYTENRRRVNAVGTLGRDDGEFFDQLIQQREINTDMMVSANRPLAEEISLRAIVGLNVNERSFQMDSNIGRSLAVPGLYVPGNAADTSPNRDESLRRLYGVFGDVTLGWRDAIFLNLTGRNDVTSTLQPGNRSFFYPSASLSAVVTDLVDLDPNVLSYAKIRLNASRVGSDTGPYLTRFRFFPTVDVFGQYGTGFTFPFHGVTAASATNVMPTPDMGPQFSTTFEIGTELGFLHDRLLLDVTLYDIVTTDVILSLPRPPSTGFDAHRMNVGEISNRGVEVMLQANVFRFGDFSHTARLTYAANRQRVNELADGVEEITMASGFNSLQVRAEPGESLGLYGMAFLRDPESGLPVIHPLTGLRLAGEVQRLGSIDPNFNLGFSNTFRYGPVSLSALIHWRDGGVVYSQTVASQRRLGLVDETVPNRDGVIIDHGVICPDRDAEGNPINCRANDVPVVSMPSFWGQHQHASIQEGGIFDASYVKLREVVLTFDVPANLLQRTPFGAASLSLEGRNLALLYSRVPHIDPESNLFGSGLDSGGYEFNVLPNTRQFGVNLNFQF